MIVRPIWVVSAVQKDLQALDAQALQKSVCSKRGAPKHRESERHSFFKKRMRRVFADKLCSDAMYLPSDLVGSRPHG